MAGMEQLFLPAPPSHGEEIPAHSSIGTAQLRHRDITAETQAGSAGATSWKCWGHIHGHSPRGIGHRSSLAYRAQLTTDLSTFTLAYGQQTTPRYLTKKDCGTWPVLLIPELEEKFTQSAHTHVPPLPTWQAGKPHINKA